MNPVNPITRFRNFLGLSRAEFARVLDMNEQGLLYLERGCYDRVPERVEAYFARRNLPVDTLQSAYSDYITQVRANFKEKYGDLVNQLPKVSSQGSPAAAWWEGLGETRSGLAKHLCVQPAFLYKLEKKKAPHLPGQFREALHEIGMTEYNIDELEERQVEFYYG